MPYLIPDDLEPEDIRCIKVWIPIDPQWSSVFWGNFHELTRWWNHERDSEHKAAIVANLWRDLWQRADQAYHDDDDCEDCMSYDTRVKPGQPWVQQASVDGGLTWHDSLIQANWNITIYREPVSEERAGELSALFYRNWHLWMIQRFAEGIANGDTKAVTLNAIMGQLAPYGASGATASALSYAYDTYAGHTTEEQTADADECTYLADENDLADKIADDAHWLDKLADWLTTLLNDAASELTGALNSAAAMLGGDNLANWFTGDPNGGGGAGFGGDCEQDSGFDYNGSHWELRGPILHTIGAPSGTGSDHSDGGSRWKQFLRDLADGEVIEGMYAHVIHSHATQITSAFNPDPTDEGEDENVPFAYAGGGFNGSDITFAWHDLTELDGGVWAAAGLATPDHNGTFQQGDSGHQNSGPMTMALGIVSSVDNGGSPEQSAQWRFYWLVKIT